MARTTINGIPLAVAAYVITDTFHGTVFSLKYGRPFATITRDNNRNKTVDLLHKFGLNNREVRSITELERVLEQPYDTEAVQNIIAAEQEKTKAYLTNAI